MQGALLAPSVPKGSAGILGANLAMLSSVIAPLYVLGLGALALNLDTISAWILASWVALGAALSILFAQPPGAQWSSLVVLWPAAALATAFALDRLRAAATDSTGAWSRQASVYLMTGVVAAAAILGWMSLYENAMHYSDAASAVGRSVRRAVAAGENPTVVVSRPWSDADVTVLAFLADGTVEEARNMLVPADSLPAEFPAGALLIFAAHDRSALQQALVQYPDGDLKVYRVLRGNPAAYTYVIE